MFWVSKTTAATFGRSCAFAFVSLLCWEAGCNSQLGVRPFLAGVQTPPEALLIAGIDPPAGASGVSASAAVQITFSREVDPSSLGGRPVILTPVGSTTPVDGSAALVGDGSVLRFQPADPLATPAASYQIDLNDSIRAKDGGTLDPSGSAISLPSEFTTEIPADRDPPVFDGIKTFQSISSSALRAGWDPATDGSTPQAAIVYRIYLGPAADQIDFTHPAAESAPGATEALATGLTAGTLYFAAVRAHDLSGNEDGNRAFLSATTSTDQDTTPPDFHGLKEAHGDSTSSVSLSWDAATDNRDAASNIRYRVYLTDQGAIDYDQPTLTSDGGAGTASLTGLTADALYQVAVRAVDTSDNADLNTVMLNVRPLASFSKQVAPSLRSSCTLPSCHNAASHRNGLDTSTYKALIAGGTEKNPNTIVKGDGIGSLFIWRCDDRSPHFQTGVDWAMPTGRPKITRLVLDSIIRWIDQGANNN